MKYLVISDIHGSLGAAQLCQSASLAHGTDAVICLGDILYHGPRNDLPEDYAPKQVTALMNSMWHDIIAVRGNCDAEIDDMVLDFPVTADYNILYLGGHRVFLSHGHIYGPDRLPKLEKGDIFISGHTHVPTAMIHDGFYLLNPGSAALPKEGHPRTYAVLSEDSFTVYTTEGKEYLHIGF